MKKRALRKDFYIEIRRSLGRFLSIFFIVAIGTAFFSGIRASEPDMRYSGDEYFDEKNLMDIQVMSTLGLTDEDVKALKAVDGIEKVEAGYSTDVTCTANDSQEVLHVLSLLPTLNEVTVEEGRLPKAADECALDVDFLSVSGYKIGDQITFSSGTDEELSDTLKYSTYEIVGTLSSPMYISFHRGSTTIGTGTINGFAYVLDQAFSLDVYTELYASVEGAKELTAFTDDYGDRVEEVIDKVEAIRKERENARSEEVIGEAQEELDKARQELEDGKKEAQEKLDEAAQQLEDARTQIEDGQRQLDDGWQQVIDARAQIDSGWSQIYTARQQLINGRNQLESGKSQASSGRAQFEEAKSQLEPARAQIEASRTELTNNQTELDTNRSTIQGQLTAINEQVSGFETMKTTRDQLQLVVDSGEATPEQEAQLAELEAQIAQIEPGITEAQQSIPLLEAGLAELDAAQQKINEGWSQLTAAETSLAEGENELAAREQELIAAEQQIAQTEQQLASAESTIAVQEQQLWAAEAELASQEPELAQAEADLAAARSELADGEKEYADAQAEAEAEIQDGEKKLQDAEDEVSKIEHAKWYVNDRDSLTEYSGYGENADRIRAIGKVFPVLFFLVAALISLTTMTRMVEEQRTQIGTMKALGYERRSIAGKYLGYAALATVTGSIFGILFGEKVFPRVIIIAYGIMYQHIPNIVTPYEWKYALMASAAALACTIMATYFSCGKELREQAAELMRPPSPKQGKRVFLERIPFFWTRLSFSWKASVRNLVRYKKRFFMTLFGIGGCMALLLVGFGLKDSIFDIGAIQYYELQLYDANLILNTEATTAEQQEAGEVLEADSRVDKTSANLLESVKVKNGKTKKDVYLNVPESVSEFEHFMVFRDRVSHEEYELDDEGVILTEKMAKMLEVGIGDTVTIEDDVRGDLEVKVSNICENYMSHYMYMAPKVYEKLYGRAPEYNAIYFSVKEGKEDTLTKVGEKVLKEEGALSVSYTEDMVEQLDDMLGSLNIVIVVLVISAGLLAFVVLYNLNNINITERKRELATLKVLGFYPGEVSAYVYRENMILTVFGGVFGMLLGAILHQFIIVTVEIDSAMFGRNINPDSFLISFLITVGFSIFVNGVMYFKLKAINMVESLKSVE